MQDDCGVMYHRLAVRRGNTTTVAALITIVRVTNVGMPGRHQIRGENKHQTAMAR